MTPRAQLEQLTHGWYGYGVFAGVLTLFANGLGLASVLTAAGSTLFGFVLTFYLGRALLRRSSATRFALIGLSVLGGVLGVFGTGALALVFLSTWTLSALALVIVVGAQVLMNVRSFRVLTDRTVKGYFA